MARRNTKKLDVVKLARQAPDGSKPPERVMSEPSVRVQTNWTPQRVRAVAAGADSGSMQPLADLCDQMIRDDRYGDALQTLADAVLGAELHWERGLRTQRKRAQERVPLETEADNDWWEEFSEAEYSLILLWREMLGFCWAKLTWVVSARTGRWVPRLEFWHPRHFRYDNERRQWVLKLEQGVEQDVNAGDGWVVFYRRSTTRPWADGQWRGLSRWWILKSFAISDWGVHTEKAARAVVTADEGVSAADRKALSADLYALAKDGVVSLPHGFVYSLVEMTANTRDIYEAQINAANMAGSIAILGQNLTTEISANGSRAASETHERKEARKIRYVAESLATTLHAQVMTPWAGYNFGELAEPPWHVWQVSPPDDTAAKATTFSNVAKAISTLQTAGKQISDEQLREEFGIELEDIPADKLARAQQALKPPQEPEAEPEEAEPDEAEPDKPPKSTARAAPVVLASGIPPSQSKGFIAGQVYTDDVADATRDKSTDALSAFVDKLVKAIGSADDYESIREAVLRAYEGEAAPERLAELVEHAIIIAQLGGRLAVHEDA